MDTKQALAEVNKLHNMFRGVQDLKEVLEHAAGLEQNEKEIKQRIEKLKAEEGGLADRINGDLREVEKTKQQANDCLSSAKYEAVKIIAEAEAKAKLMLDTAAERESVMGAQIAKAQDQLAKLNADIDNKQVEYDKLEDKFTKLKAKIADIANS